MNKIFSWTSNQTYNNRWDRMALTNKGSYIVAHIIKNDDDTFASNVQPSLPNQSMITESFSSLEAAKSFADKEIAKQGF